MDSHYVGRQFYTPVGQRKYAVARGSGKGNLVVFTMHGRIEGGHEMEKPLTFGILAGIFDMQQLPKVARVR